ncbi:MAG: hypothetical protein GY769_04545 [bacterium]|nr:hypothetical protein [bacterium]
MAATIRRVDYFYATVKDRPGAAYTLLASLAESEVNLLAFSAVPSGPASAQLTLFPENSEALVRAAGSSGVVLAGPEHAILVQGDDELGALAAVHRRLYDANVDVYTSTGVAGGSGHYGYLIYVRSGQFEDAARALGI